MKAVVLGANGYIARNFLQVNNVCRYAQVRAYGRRPEHIDGFPDYCQFDPYSRSDMAAAIDDCALIYVFAGKTGTSQGFNEPEEFLEANERILLCLLSAYRGVDSRAKIVFPSTRLVYKGSERSLAEDAPKQFLTPYAMNKYACEQYLEMYQRQFGVRYCVLRIGVPYGTLVQPVSSYGTLDSFLRQARERGAISLYGDGSQRRTVTYIEDLCQVLWLAGMDDSCVNDVYNVSGETISVRELAEYVAQATGTEVISQPWPLSAQKIESGSTVFDAKKLSGRMPFQPTMTVKRWITEMTQEKNRSTHGGVIYDLTIVALSYCFDVRAYMREAQR